MASEVSPGLTEKSATANPADCVAAALHRHAVGYGNPDGVPGETQLDHQSRIWSTN